MAHLNTAGNETVIEERFLRGAAISLALLLPVSLPGQCPLACSPSMNMGHAIDHDATNFNLQAFINQFHWGQAPNSHGVQAAIAPEGPTSVGDAPVR